MWEILFRHQDFVAINKPQGISVHRSDGEVSLTATLAAQLGVEKVWLLHRLDKQTGGILLFALNSQSAAVLAGQFAERKMKKTYLALSDRKPSKKQGWIKGGMEKSRRGMWKLTRNMENIAVTRFFSIRISEKMRLFILEPHTGKTHQLRVAMKSLGSPILGDSLYGGTESETTFLYAWKIQFTYQQQEIEITAPLKNAWQAENISHALEEFYMAKAG